MQRPILVLGATGTVGAPLVADLVARGLPVRAASRAATPVAGAEAVRVDLDAPATLAAAMDGAGAVLALLPSGTLDVAGRLGAVLDAARDAGAKVVLQSVMGADADEANPYRQAELRLAREGRPHVVLRPNWFMDNFHTFWGEGVRAGRLALPAGDGATSLVDARDIAAVAAEALAGDRLDGRALELTGPEAVTYAEAAAVLSRAAGTPIAYVDAPEAEFVDAAAAAGLPRAYAEFLAMIFGPVRAGWTARVTDAVREATGRAPRSLAAYAADHAAALRRPAAA